MLASMRSRRRSRMDRPVPPADGPCRKHDTWEASSGGHGSPPKTQRCQDQCAVVALRKVSLDYTARMTESPHAVPHCRTDALAIWLAPALARNCRTISQIEFHPAT